MRRQRNWKNSKGLGTAARSARIMLGLGLVGVGTTIDVSNPAAFNSASAARMIGVIRPGSPAVIGHPTGTVKFGGRTYRLEGAAGLDFQNRTDPVDPSVWLWPAIESSSMSASVGLPAPARAAEPEDLGSPAGWGEPTQAGFGVPQSDYQGSTAPSLSGYGDGVPQVDRREAIDQEFGGADGEIQDDVVDEGFGYEPAYGPIPYGVSQTYGNSIRPLIANNGISSNGRWVWVEPYGWTWVGVRRIGNGRNAGLMIFGRYGWARVYGPAWTQQMIEYFIDGGPIVWTRNGPRPYYP